MQSLFDIQPNFPDGFFYSEDFISESEETLLLETISSLELHTFLFQGFEAKRKVASYGYDYSFDKRSISKGKAIPEEFQFVVEKAAKFFKIDTSSITELLVTEYPVGSVINWHRDAPPFETIIGISLLA